MNDYPEDNLDEIVKSIFSQPPGKICSIQLQLEEETSKIAEQYGVNSFVFNILYMITLKGIRYLYGDIPLVSLTESQLDLVKEYTRSYEYELLIKIENERVMINFNPINFYPSH